MADQALILLGAVALLEMHLRPTSVWRAKTTPEFFVRCSGRIYQKFDPATNQWNVTTWGALMYPVLEFELIKSKSSPSEKPEPDSEAVHRKKTTGQKTRRQRLRLCSRENVRGRFRPVRGE